MIYLGGLLESFVVQHSCLSSTKIIFTTRKSFFECLDMLLTATSEHKQACVCSAKTSRILWEDWHASTHVCWLSVCICVCVCEYMCCPAFCFCGVFLLGPKGVFLEVQTSLKESKIESWERTREVKEGQRGVLRGRRRLNKQR